MKRLASFTAVGIAVAVAAATVIAQGPPSGQQLGLAASLLRSYNGVKQNLTEEAEKMPEADYNFKPGPAPELRTSGLLFAHLANAQFGSCAIALGVPNPNQGHNLETELKTKAEFTKALADSFALCDKAFAALTDQNAMEMVKQGQGEIARAAVLANTVIHSNEMYGTGSVYMGAKGLVPPSTERATQMQQGGRGGRGAPGR
jgi:DinB superfamily